MFAHHLIAVTLTALLAVTRPAVAAPATTDHQARTLIPLPADDPFYQPPSGFESKDPGAILRSRTIDASFFSLIPNPVEAWQVLYRTTAVNGSAIATVTTIFKPWNAKLDRFVSYATAYDSSATKCDPSYAYQLGSNSFDNLDTDLEFLIIEGYLLQGYIVSSSNYEGPDAAFTPGHLEGMCLLDSLRAVGNFADDLGLSTNTPNIVATGYSGGAIATGWASTLQPSYAPELSIKGWNFGGTPVNLTSVMLYIDNTAQAGFLPAAVAGLAAPSAYKETLQPVLDDIVTEEGREALEYARTHCMSDDLAEFAFVSLLSYDFQSLGPDLLQQPDLQDILQDNVMGATKDLTPTAPVFMFHAEDDEIIPYADASALADEFCRRGVDITFTTHDHGGHVSTAVLGVPASYKFAIDAFDGDLDRGCHRESAFSSIFDLIGLAVDLEPLLAKLINLLG